MRKLIVVLFFLSFHFSSSANFCHDPYNAMSFQFKLYVNGISPYPAQTHFSFFSVETIRFMQYDKFDLRNFAYPAQPKVPYQISNYHVQLDDAAVFCRMEAYTQRNYGVMFRIRTGGY
jgi:hypothetical protein